MKNLLKKLSFWKKETPIRVEPPKKEPKKEPKYEWRTKTEEVEEDSIDVKVTLVFKDNFFGNVSHTFKACYGYFHRFRYRGVISGDNSYYDWYERNKNVNIISLDGQPYLLSDIKEIIKEEIPVKVKYEKETVYQVEVKE